MIYTFFLKKIYVNLDSGGPDIMTHLLILLHFKLGRQNLHKTRGQKNSKTNKVKKMFQGIFSLIFKESKARSILVRFPLVNFFSLSHSASGSVQWRPLEEYTQVNHGNPLISPQDITSPNQFL